MQLIKGKLETTKRTLHQRIFIKEEEILTKDVCLCGTLTC